MKTTVGMLRLFFSDLSIIGTEKTLGPGTTLPVSFFSISIFVIYFKFINLLLYSILFLYLIIYSLIF